MLAIEINKFIGAALTAALFLMLVNMLADSIFRDHSKIANPAYAIGTLELEIETAEPAKNPNPSLGVLLANSDSASGKKISKKCIACHTFGQGQASKIGPNLWDVIGRDIASGTEFPYSKALQNVEGRWDFVELDKFLTSPKKYAKGTKMAFPGLPKPSERADVLMYLRSLSPIPATLPRN
ncbi:MAG: cytochrome c family protein [Pseudomonadota bacterium]|nr:cytochrome c family protein [Pseudomonadota bacterium]